MIPDERKREFEAAIRRDIPRNMLVEVRTLFPELPNKRTSLSALHTKR